jgi:hypothetical protein
VLLMAAMNYRKAFIAWSLHPNGINVNVIVFLFKRRKR